MRASRELHPVRLRAGSSRAWASLVAVGVLLAATAMPSRAQEPAANPPKPAATPAVTPAVKAPSKAPALSDGAVNKSNPAAKNRLTSTPGGKVNAKPASLGARGGPVEVATAMRPTKGAPTTLAHLDDRLTYQYNALGRRDPFQSLVGGEFVGNDVGGDAPPDPGGIRVVGIVWGASDQFALVEDVKGNSFVLRKGDKVQNGYVEGLKRDGIIVTITADGQNQSIIIPLTRKGDSNAR